MKWEKTRNNGYNTVQMFNTSKHASYNLHRFTHNVYNIYLNMY